MPPIALLFPGQGSHHVGMDAPWRDHPLLERGLELLGEDPFPRLAEGTRFQQPALFLVCACAWAEEDLEDGDVVATAGHSLGEVAALHAAGVLAFDDAVRLVAARGAAMAAAAAARPGGMVALLGGDPRAVAGLAVRHGLVVANDNAPGQVVLAGPLEALAAAEERAHEETGARARRLDVAGAFHSPLMAPAQRSLRAALDEVEVHPPRVPAWSGGTAAPFGPNVRAELAANLLRPVRWREVLLGLRAAGAERFVELGPGAVLTGLAKRTLAVAA